jgi:hypothetical protein
LAPRCDSRVRRLGPGRDGGIRPRAPRLGWRLAQTLEFLFEIDQRNDAGTLLVTAEKHPLSEDVHRHHALGALTGAERLALLGEPFTRCDIELVLVLETAEQAAAAAGDLGRVEREMLILGEGQADR